MDRMLLSDAKYKKIAPLLPWRTPPRPPVRKLILGRSGFPAQLHQADAPQYLATEHRSPLQHGVWLGVILKRASSFFVFLIFDGVALFADWNVRCDDEAAAFEKAGAVLGTGLIVTGFSP